MLDSNGSMGGKRQDRIYSCISTKKIAIENCSKRALAKELITKIGIDRKYDLYVGGSADMAFLVGVQPKLKQWMQRLIASEAG